MCGVVGAVAQRNVVPILLEGLKRLEYRGYDSAGLVVSSAEGALERVRSTGRVAELADRAKALGVKGELGIAHTRWATHGVPSEENAHPHISQQAIAVVHNGIIENYAVLKARLEGAGYVFESETDTEVIAHLIHAYSQKTASLLDAVQSTLKELEGAYAIGVMSVEAPHEVVCARQGSPLLIGIGIEEHFFASDVSALLPVTQRVMYLEEGDVAVLSLTDVQVFNALGEAVERAVHTSELSADMAELGTYRHFMQKEIHEQPRALGDTLERLGHQRMEPALFGVTAAEVFKSIESVQFIACGTSFHAALVAKYWIEEVAQLPVSVEVASEFRYREVAFLPKPLVVTISQSGETADTLAALKYAKELGCQHTLAICNVAESSLIRQSELAFLTQAGPEIGVASTKAFTTQLVALFVLAQVLAKVKGRLSVEKETEGIEALRHLPHAVNAALTLEPAIQKWATQLAEARSALFLGRNSLYPIALEGALKLKEISYIHAEAYAAGELKHGPLALVDREMPIIVCAPVDGLLDKLKSNLQEVKARGGVVFVLTEEGSGLQAEPDFSVLTLPMSLPRLSPILFTIPLQVLSYHTALKKGTDVDKPRNLAKSVTVE